MLLAQQVPQDQLARLAPRVRLDQRERPVFKEIQVLMVLLARRARLVPLGLRVRPERLERASRVRLVPMARLESRVLPELTEQLVLPVRMDLMELLELLEPLGLLDLRGLQDRPETRDLKV